MTHAFHCTGTFESKTAQDLPVKFGPPDLDTGGMVTSAADATYFKVPANGIYRLSAAVNMPQVTADANFYVKLEFHDQDSGKIIGYMTAWKGTVYLAGLYRLTAGQRISVVFGQACGATQPAYGIFFGHML